MQTAYHTNNQNNSVYAYKNLSHINGPKQFCIYIYENLNHINGSKSFDTSSSLFLPISTPILLSF